MFTTKVYVLTKHSAYNLEPTQEVIGTYGSMEEAQTELANQFEKAKAEFSEEADATSETTDTSFDWYVEGEYCENHISCEIFEKELNISSYKFFEQQAEDYINNVLEDKLICALTDKEVGDISAYVGERLCNDEHVWREVNDAIEYYIYHSPLMLEKQDKLEEMLKRIDKTKIDEIAERYCVSEPISGKWETEVIHERDTLMDELNLTEKEAEFIMLNYLGFEPSDFKEED